jgi:predicted nucleotidyltransferase
LFDEKLEEIAAACRKNGIVRMFVFGSAFSNDFKPVESNIEPLVEFGPLQIARR